MISTQNTTQDIIVWKALADPTRRELLDLLRLEPRTTGDLIRSFSRIGRCAVMKHLGILEQAHLITSWRKGKYRWNRINPIPLQAIYERWVKKYEEQWATNLLKLKELSETSTNKLDNIMETIKLTLSIPIKAPIDHVWKCLLLDVNSWWRSDFYTSDKTQEFIIEPKVGGRMYEDYGNDEGLLWAEVIVLNSPHTLELKGHLTPQFGGPAINFLQLKLSESEGITNLLLTDTVMGDVNEGNTSSMKSGWKMLFDEGLRAFAEKTA